MFDVKGWASSFLRVHIPFFCWADDFATAFEAFHQVIFTSLLGAVVGWTWMGRWVRILNPCPPPPTAILRPYMFDGI